MAEVAEGRDEAQIIASILAGKTNEFHVLIRPYERSVYAMALSLLHNQADAEDAAQEAFLKAFRHLARFRAEAKFSAWLISIILNEARSRLRQRKVLKLQSLDEPLVSRDRSPALLPDWREVSTQTLVRQEVRRLLERPIASRPS